METKGQEAITNPIAQTETAFGNFQSAAQKGFTTQGESLTAYKALLTSVDNFLGGVKKPTAQDKELFKKMFLDHQKTYTLPVAVFLEVNRKIQQASFSDYGLPKDSRFTDRVAIARRMIGSELESVSVSLQQETLTVEELQQLARGEQPVPLSGIPGTPRELQKVAVAKLSQEPELQQDVRDKDAFTSTVEHILKDKELTPDQIRQSLEPYPQYLTASGTTIEEIYLRATHRQNDRVQQLLRRAADNASSPEFLWELWTQKGEIPRELTENFEQVMALLEIEAIALELIDHPASQKAATFLPFLNKGVSSGLLLEIAKGNYEFPQNFAVAQVDALLHFFDTYEEIKQTKPTPLKFKVAAAIAAGTIIATPFILHHIQGGGEPAGSAEVASLLEKIPPETLNDLDNTALPGQNTSPETQDTVGAFDVNSFEGKPDNDSAEAFAEAAKHTIWKLEGKNLDGYYRSEPASIFNPQKHTWKTEYKYEPNSKVQFATTSEIKVTGHLPSVGQYIPIPVKEGMAVTNNSLRFTDLNNHTLPAPPLLLLGSIFQTTNGSYFIYISDKTARSNNLEVSYSIGKAENIIKPPTPTELAHMSEIMITRDQLPKDFKDLLTGLDARNDLSTQAKAKVIEKYFQESFLYSLNPKWSNFYHQAPSGGEFIKRILEGKKADCDVTNTALVAVLRAYGIPTRLGGGFSNGSFLDHHSDALTGVEAHGWTEAYINNKWLRLDGTSGNPDPYTKKAFEQMDLGGSLDSPNLQDLLDKDNLSLHIPQGTHANDDFAYFLEGAKDYFGDHPVFTTIFSIIVLNSISRLGAGKIDNKNREHIRRLQDELRKRAEQYMTDPTALNSILNAEEDMLRSKRTGSAQGIHGYLLPPAGIAALIKTLARSSKLEAVPYNKAHEPNAVIEPSAIDFMVNALGYDEKGVKAVFEAEAYNRTWNRLFRSEQDLFHDQHNFMPDKTRSAIHGAINDAFDDLSKIDNLTTLSNQLATNLYPRYQDLVAKEAKKNRKDTSKVLTEREFKELIANAARLTLINMQVEAAHDQALASLGMKR